MRQTFYFILLFTVPIQAAEPLSWVKPLVDRRVETLFSEGKKAEDDARFNAATGIYADILLIDPTNQRARKRLDRATKKGQKKDRRTFQRKWKTGVKQAVAMKRNHQRNVKLLQRKQHRAERDFKKGKLLEAFDRYYQLENENGLKKVVKEMQGKIKQRKASPGFKGFVYFFNKEWGRALRAWSRDGSKHRWATYYSQAKQNQISADKAELVDRIFEQAKNEFETGTLTKAQEKFQTLLALSPNHNEAKRYLKIIPQLKKAADKTLVQEMTRQRTEEQLNDARKFFIKGYLVEAEMRVRAVLSRDATNKKANQLLRQIQLAHELPPDMRVKTTKKTSGVDQWYRDGLGAYANGNYDEARTLWMKVLDQDPSHEKAWRALKKVLQ